MAAPSPKIDLNVLRSVIEQQERMAAAFDARAGQYRWDWEQQAKYRRNAECLKAVLAHFEGRQVAAVA